MKLLILGAGKIQTPIIKKAKDKGHTTLVVDYDKNAPGFRYADFKFIVSTNDKDKILEIAKKHNIQGILTTSDFPVNSVAYVAHKLKLNALSTEAARISTNKFLFREFQKKNGFNYPKYFLINETNINNIDDFPFIIKPVDSSASRGVVKISSKQELIKEFPITKSFSNSGNVIAEEIIEGKEYSVETITQNNNTEIIAITEKLLFENTKHFVEAGHLIPANISEREFNIIKKEIIHFLDKIKLNNSVSHTEIKILNNEIYIIESGFRLGGDYITSDLVPLATGVDMLSNAINLATGIKTDTQKKFNRYAGIRFIDNKNYKYLFEIIKSGANFIKKYEISDFKNKRIENSLDRFGYLIFSADNKNKFTEIINLLNNENK